MNKVKLSFLLFVFFSALSIGAFPCNSVAVKSGADVFFENNTGLIKGKRVGIVTNQSAILSDGTHIVDRLSASGICDICALFSPEHGIRGDAADGKVVTDSVDKKTGIREYSLFGKIYKPSPQMLKSLDFLIYDIQDAGTRYYTFISTLYNVMEAAAENHIPVIVLDRPDPIGGLGIEGPVLNPEYKSFVGIAPISVRYGMTPGELAGFYNGELLSRLGLKADLRVIKMDGWKRELYYDQTGLKWLNPSPNLKNIDALIAYPGICLI